MFFILFVQYIPIRQMQQTFLISIYYYLKLKVVIAVDKFSLTIKFSHFFTRSIMMIFSCAKCKLEIKCLMF